jgi:hypothetical protein
MDAITIVKLVTTTAIDGSHRMRLVFAALLSFAAVGACAQTVYRCTDAAGQINYTDRPCLDGRFLAIKPNVLPSEGARRDVEAQRKADELAARAASAPPCRFAHYAIGDTMGKALSEAARKECINNHMTGGNNRTAYEMWRDHRQMETARRGHIINSAPRQVIILNR